MTHAIENSLDGTDRLRNIEKVEFADGGALNVIVGTPYNDNGLAPVGAAPFNQQVLNGTATDDLILGLAGADVLNGLRRQRHPRRRTMAATPARMRTTSTPRTLATRTARQTGSRLG